MSKKAILIENVLSDEYARILKLQRYCWFKHTIITAKKPGSETKQQ